MDAKAQPQFGTNYRRSCYDITTTDEDEEKNANGQISQIFHIVYEKCIFNFADLAEYLITEDCSFRKYSFFRSIF